MSKLPVPTALHCDACHHEVRLSDLHEGLIGFPCPVCLTSMLSEKEYHSARRMFVVVRVLKFLRLVRSPRPNERRILRVQVSDDGVRMRQNR